jgi:hypothetical protein
MNGARKVAVATGRNASGGSNRQKGRQDITKKSHSQKGVSAKGKYTIIQIHRE